jgi:hypothetical protein
LYVKHAIRETLALDTHMVALRDGFFGYKANQNRLKSEPCQVLRHIQMLLSTSASTVQYLICGVHERGGGGGGGSCSDFDVRELFRVRQDEALLDCGQMCDAFWSVVDAMSPGLKRKFLKFVTGVEHLPEKGTEVITIEMPFMPLTQGEHEQLLKMLPQVFILPLQPHSYLNVLLELCVCTILISALRGVN